LVLATVSVYILLNGLTPQVIGGISLSDITS
jgi:hypothetical protein